jgi:hypothetical protein
MLLFARHVYQITVPLSLSVIGRLDREFSQSIHPLSNSFKSHTLVLGEFQPF